MDREEFDTLADYDLRLSVTFRLRLRPERLGSCNGSSIMYGPAVAITSHQDLLVYGGVVFLSALLLLSLVMPRWLRH